MTSEDEPTKTDETASETPDRIRHEWDESDHPSTAVIEAVVVTTGRDPTAIPPLHDYVDADALNALVTPRSESTTAISVSFLYDGVIVRVDSKGWIEVQPESTYRE